MKHRRWTKSLVAELRAVAATGVCRKQAARLLDMSHHSVGRIARAHGIAFERSARNRANLVSRIAAGQSREEVAAAWKVSVRYLCGRASLWGVRVPRSGPKKWTPALVAEVLAMRDRDHLRWNEVAARFDAFPTTPNCLAMIASRARRAGANGARA